MNRVLYINSVLLALLFFFAAGCNRTVFQNDQDLWRLKTYEAVVTGDSSICAMDKYCLDHARYIRSLICISNVCDGKDKSKKPIDCAKAFADQYPPETREKISSSLCSLIATPNASTRKSYLSLVKEEQEDEVVEEGGYAMALKGSASSCEDYIKNFVGPYGPGWSYQWYRALSGCRVLARVRTREQEEKDFVTWLGVEQGKGQCSSIINSEMRQACSAPGASSPKPTDEHLW